MAPANYSITWHQETLLEISRYANNRGTEEGGDGEVNQKRSSSNILVLPWPHPNIKPIEIFFLLFSTKLPGCSKMLLILLCSC